MMHQKPVISSLRNPLVRRLRRLRERRERQRRRVFCVEGAREALRALQAGYVCEEMLACPELFSDESHALVSQVTGERVSEVSAEVFAKVVVRKGFDGVFVVFREVERRLQDDVASRQPVLIALEQVEKPGNVGAVIRSADGAGLDGVILLGPHADPYNPNTIRASLGTVFSTPVFTADADEFRQFCRDRHMKIVAATLTEGTKTPFELDLTGGLAFVLGAEDAGISAELQSVADECVSIPMRGVADSLNVSAAAAVLMYEALRQRGQA